MVALRAWFPRPYDPGHTVAREENAARSVSYGIANIFKDACAQFTQTFRSVSFSKVGVFLVASDDDPTDIKIFRFLWTKVHHFTVCLLIYPMDDAGKMLFLDGKNCLMPGK